MEIRDDLSQQYSNVCDDDLLRLALDAEELTPDAKAALTEELARRRINGAERLQAFRGEEEERKQEHRRKTGSLFLLHPYGIGRTRFGKAERTYDSQSQTERFRTTVFVLFFWLPLIPTGTFLVERKGSFLSREMTVLERLPLDWEQVMKVWIVAGVSLLILIWFIDYCRGSYSAPSLFLPVMRGLSITLDIVSPAEARAVSPHCRCSSHLWSAPAGPSA